MPGQIKNGFFVKWGVILQSKSRERDYGEVCCGVCFSEHTGCEVMREIFERMLLSADLER